MTSTYAAARLMGLYPRKGTIAVGSDPELTVLDPAATWTVDHEQCTCAPTTAAGRAGS